MTHPIDDPYFTAYFSEAIGLVITGFEWSEDGFPVLICKAWDLDEPVRLEISSDLEGNAPGFIHGLPLPPQAAAKGDDAHPSGHE